MGFILIKIQHQMLRKTFLNVHRNELPFADKPAFVLWN
jgi:hypothetical protein